jgi:hypothetical protein
MDVITIGNMTKQGPTAPKRFIVWMWGDTDNSVLMLRLHFLFSLEM